MSLEDLGRPLVETTFVVVDLETTGTRADSGGITEIGAVKVRGGENVGEFSTLVNPGQPIPAFITLLTGITEAMVAPAPPIGAVLPSLLEFLGADLLVAHNAPFDVGFLKAACAREGYAWPSLPVVDTLALARRLVPRDEVRDHKLATLARHFAVETAPSHRALDDARATAGLLHALLERSGRFGVDTAEELRSFTAGPPPTAVQRRKRSLADDIPAAPGVYVFEDAEGTALYVGKSTHLRKRVKSYFTAAERRGRIRDMIAAAQRVRPIVCATPLEAEVRELRIIAERDPAFNRRSRRPHRASWLRLTTEAFPRLSITRGLSGAGPYLGPFTSRTQAELAREALHQAFPLRQCTKSVSRPTPGAACVLAQLGRGGAPCEGEISADDYAVHAEAARGAMTADCTPVVEALRTRIAALSAELRYEEAASHRDRLAAFLTGAGRAQRLTALARCAQIVAARPRALDDGRAYELCVVRYGRLAGTAVTDPGEDPWPRVHALVSTAETVEPPRDAVPAPRADAPEMECVLRWLESSTVRLVEVQGTWASPLGGARGYADLTDWERGSPTAE
jgi:DNA polymerase III subunit epsilon